jgi:mannonate dehydratase
MVGKGWSRTGVRLGRGGAKATYFSLKELTPNESDGSANASPLQSAGALVEASDKSELKISHDQVWANYEYFIKAVMPTAEKWGVRMALHPDDPCLDSLGGYARIFGSVEAYDRAYALYPSPSNAVTFCQANFKLMFTNGNCHNCSQIANTNVAVATGSLGVSENIASVQNLQDSKTPSSESNLNPVNPVQTLADAARHFGKRIAFIHVRDVEGDKTDFTELFHDQGDTDQFALMRTYRELGLDVPVRGDHVPEMAYDRVLTPEGTPGYFTLGRLFANGYLKALLKGTYNA